MSWNVGQWSRRKVIQALAVSGLTAGADSVTAKGDDDDNANDGKEEDEVQLRHVLDLPNVQQRLDEYQKSGKPDVFYQRQLKEHLRENPGRGSFDLTVTTIGESNTIETNRRGRTVHGWRPTDPEIGTLSQFGEVGYVPDFSSTEVTVSNVSRDAVAQMARLDFVVRVNHIPNVHLNSCVTGTDVRGSDYTGFDYVEGDYSTPTSLRFGFIDTGYEASKSKYASPHAQDTGIDTSLANDFSRDNDWQLDSGAHGTNVTDTAAYMLGDDGHNSLFVPLKVWPHDFDPNDEDDSIIYDNIRSAIDYATKNDIEVLCDTIGTPGYDYCPEHLCSHYDAYTLMGYLSFATSGNDGHLNNGKVDMPGGSWYTIAAGTISGGSCTNADYPRAYSSEYGDIDLTQCDYCSTVSGSAFCPSVYGANVKTDAGNCLEGTSYAAPEAAVTGVIMRSNGLTNYGEARSICRGMNAYEICSDSAAQAGQLLDAIEAYNQTSGDPIPVPY